jgi:hypothetical protein
MGYVKDDRQICHLPLGIVMLNCLTDWDELLSRHAEEVEPQIY